MRIPEVARVARLHPLPASTTLYRVHKANFAGNAFNPCKGGPSRFAPLHDGSGQCIPTSYAATTLDGAAFESVFHGIRDKYESVRREDLDKYSISSLETGPALDLVPFFTPELLRWRIDPSEFFRPSDAAYAHCRTLAFRAWRDNPGAHGLVWSSVRDSHADAMLLFGDRLSPSDLGLAASRPVRTDSTALADLETAGQRAGLTIVR
ncbi:MAG: RES family NAD+ phosphorylase [Boseongicola sp. SB0677_bin_26]|nr:RES family NAD+ phosphorylase [Boseongicola sp. SB0665_bin_10]MYG28536.1 RES family NAD+ phosphorylase [Boseongicola sp. SB0677_bin_26]